MISFKTKTGISEHNHLNYCLYKTMLNTNENKMQGGK